MPTTPSQPKHVIRPQWLTMFFIYITLFLGWQSAWSANLALNLPASSLTSSTEYAHSNALYGERVLAVDGNESSFWQARANGDAWFKADLGVTSSISRITFTTNYQATGNTYTLSTSSIDGNYTAHSTLSLDPSQTYTWDFTATPLTNVRWVKIDFVNGTGWYPSIRELQIHDTAGGGGTTYTITAAKAGTGSGTVTSNVGGINCGTTCTSTALASGTSVTLTAAAASGSTFAGWSGGGCSGTGTCIVSLTANTTVTATFNPITYTLSVTKAGTGTGTVTSNTGGINCGATCTSTALASGTSVILTASPASGSTFAGWSGGGCSGTGTCTVSLTANTTVTATFNPVTYTLSVTKSGTGSGTVTSNTGGINCGTTCTSTALASGTSVTLTATPASGSTFAGWSGGGCTGTGTCTVSLTANTTVTATFNVTTSNYTLSVTKNGTGSGTVTSNTGGINCGTTCTSTALASGTSVTLTAAAASGSTFAGWSGGVCSGTGTCAVNLTGNTTVTATFNLSTGGTQDWQINGNDLVYNFNNGNVGVGMTCPAGQPASSLCVAGNIAAKYQDVAEWVPATRLMPIGTVVVLNTENSNQVMASFKAYDTRVAGVITKMPGIILGEAGEGKVMVATTGRVKVKVDASKGAIAVGDLLVTSEVEGVAMRSQPLDLGGTPIHRPGTLIGKALEPLADGEGEILVLLSLQ